MRPQISVRHREGGVGGPRNQPRGENAKGPGGGQKLANEGLVRKCDVWGGVSWKEVEGRKVQECKASFLLQTSV